MSLKLEVGKKYLDNHGCEWRVYKINPHASEVFYAEQVGSAVAWTEAILLHGEFLHNSTRNLVSEVPTTPQFKVGDRVYVCGVGDALPGTVVGVLLKLVNVRIDGEPKYTTCYPYELMLLSDDGNASYVPHAPACTCDIHAIMRSGCSCGNARVAIEQEFKREGWK